jgi:UDP:flavonoid glycosyltransferase YjiC (YdhE family)
MHKYKIKLNGLIIADHPNMRLFITHCGVSSTQEAAYIGVPIIGLPVFGDQGHNCAKFVKEGSGILLDYENITTASFTSAIQEVLKTR